MSEAFCSDANVVIHLEAPWLAGDSRGMGKIVVVYCGLIVALVLSAIGLC